MAQPVADIKLNRQQMRQLNRDLAGIRNGVPRVLTRSINKVGRKARKDVTDEVYKRIVLKKGDLRKRNIHFRKATFRKLVGRIVVEGARIPLIRFGARELKRGVSYRLKRGGGRQKIREAFIATMPSGHRGVFIRRGRSRLPIDELHGPSVPQVLQDSMKYKSGAITRQAGERLEKEVAAQAELLIKKRHARVARG